MIVFGIYILGMFLTAFAVGKFDKKEDVGAEDMIPICVFWPIVVPVTMIAQGVLFSKGLGEKLRK